MTQAWLAQRERGSIFAIRLIVGIALLLGRPIARLLLYPISLYFLLSSAKPRAASRKYLAKVLGRAPRFGDLFRHYYAFAAVALDRVFLLKDRVDLFDARLHDEDQLKQAAARGQGCLLLGAHLGSFEILRAAAASRNLQIGVAMYEDNVSMVSTALKAINPALADSIISLGRFDSMLKMYERLRQSECVGMLGDRALDAAAQVRVPFLGEDASFPTAPFRLAQMLKRPVVLMLGIYRGGNRYEIYFEPLFDPHGVDQTNREHKIAEAVRLYAQRLEHYCREAPCNWFNFYDFWAESPAPR